MPGYSPSNQACTAAGLCSYARLMGFWGGSPSGEVLPRCGLEFMPNSCSINCSRRLDSKVKVHLQLLWRLSMTSFNRVFLACSTPSPPRPRSGRMALQPPAQKVNGGAHGRSQPRHAICISYALLVQPHTCFAAQVPKLLLRFLFPSTSSENHESLLYWPYLYLRSLGPDAGWYRVGPLARVHNCSHIPSARAEAQRQRFLAHGPVHATLAYHWARMIEMLHAMEVIAELLQDDALLGGTLTTPLPAQRPARREGVGVIEAPWHPDPPLRDRRRRPDQLVQPDRQHHPQQPGHERIGTRRGPHLLRRA